MSVVVRMRKKMFRNSGRFGFSKADTPKKLTLRDTNATRTDKVGFQPWTAIRQLLGLVSTV